MYYKDGQISSRPSIKNVINPTDKTIKENGWIPLEEDKPNYDPETQRLVVKEIHVEPDKAIREWEAVTREQTLEERIEDLEG